LLSDHDEEKAFAETLALCWRVACVSGLPSNAQSLTLSSPVASSKATVAVCEAYSPASLTLLVSETTLKSSVCSLPLSTFNETLTLANLPSFLSWSEPASRGLPGYLTLDPPTTRHDLPRQTTFALSPYVVATKGSRRILGSRFETSWNDGAC